MGHFRIPGPMGAGGYTLEVDAGTAALGTSPRPGTVGQSPVVAGEPPTGLLRSGRHWRTLPQGTVDDIRHREGRWPDGRLMAPNILRSQRLLYVQRWRESALASGADSETAAYWAMLCERIAELLALYDTPRGRLVLKLEELTRNSELDDRDKHRQLREADRARMQQEHDEAVANEGVNPGGQIEISEEEDAIVRRARSEILRLANQLNKQELQKIKQQAEALAHQPPASDLMARRRQREALAELINGKPQGKGAPDDGLPHSLNGLFQHVLGLERQDELMGGALGGDDWDALKREAGELAKAAAQAIKKVRVEAAKQNIADARKRIADHAKLTDKVARLKSEVLIREQLSEGLTQLLGMERQRQLLGVGDGPPASGDDLSSGMGAVSAGLSVNADDQELNRLAQEGAKVYAEFLKGDGSTVQALLNNLDSAPGKPLP